MSEPAPELDAEDALRGIVNQLTIHGQRMPVIIPGSVIAALDDFAALVQAAQAAGYLLDLLPRAMPWARGFSEADLEALAANLIDAASSGDHAPERLDRTRRHGQPWRGLRTCP